MTTLYKLTNKDGNCIGTMEDDGIKRHYSRKASAYLAEVVGELHGLRWLSVIYADGMYLEA